MIQAEIPKSFVTTIRVNLIDIAKIALFLERHDYKMNRKSRSKLASTGIHMMAASLAEYEIENTEQAVAILRQLNYGESLQAGRRDFKPMLKQMSKENIYLDTVESKPVINTSQSNLNDEAKRLTQKFNKRQPTPIDAAAARLILTSEAETSQLKTRTAKDERADISRLRTGLSSAPVQVLEENKTDQQ